MLSPVLNPHIPTLVFALSPSWTVWKSRSPKLFLLNNVILRTEQYTNEKEHFAICYETDVFCPVNLMHVVYSVTGGPFLFFPSH